jgi:hypothetical protein
MSGRVCDHAKSVGGIDIAKGGPVRIRQLLMVLMMFAAPMVAFAVDDDDDLAPGVLPEPGTLALLAVGAVALVAVRKNNRK